MTKVYGDASHKAVFTILVDIRSCYVLVNISGKDFHLCVCLQRRNEDSCLFVSLRGYDLQFHLMCGSLCYFSCKFIKGFVCKINNNNNNNTTVRFITFFVITNIYNKKTKGPTLMELFTATGKLKLEIFDVCTTGDTAHIVTIFKFLPHTRQHGFIG
jgi:hypothetical protein